MDIAELVETYGEKFILVTGGLVIGALFGFFAQRSKFCLRAASLEFWHRNYGEKIAVWLLAFSAAVVGVQILILTNNMDITAARQISANGSMSGALIGGLLFGAGMILTRGCASRLLILSANGNLRALLSGLIFAVTAQAALGGILSPWRESISSWWMVDGGAARNLLALLGVGSWGGLIFGLIWMAAALFFAVRSGWGLWKWVGGLGVGLSVAAAWGFNHLIATHSFEVVPVQGMTFSGPSAEWLMRVMSTSAPALGFGSGMLPGVFIGSFIGAWVGKDFKLEGFSDGYGMRRYIFGAIFMGFGAMLAGGCSVGAGITGGAIFATTAWMALIGMWAGAGLMDRLIDSPQAVAGLPEEVSGADIAP